jgi:chemotaxis protein MotB
MSAAKAAHAVIIRKKRGKKGGGGHHGGAWKVAYADFVTAMMAFFLLMWLLNATTEEQRKGLADYFNPSIPISRVSGGGPGALNGDSVFADEDLARDGAGATKSYSLDARSAAAAAERARLEAIEQKIAEGKRNAASDELADHIETRMTPDGLVIELVDGDGEPLFEVGSTQPSRLLDQLLEVVAPVIATAENDMAIVGHTDARPYAGRAGYSNWELSSERAHIARRLLTERGVPAAQIVSVIGKADRELLSEDPLAARNRRIAVVLLAFRPDGPGPEQYVVNPSDAAEEMTPPYPFLKEP